MGVRVCEGEGEAEGERHSSTLNASFEFES